MATPRRLEQLFDVEDRFRRSVNVAADYQRADALSGYVVTPLVRAILSRIAVGLSQDALNRAWSITGPYGAGKSACAVFLCQALGYPVNEEARQVLREDAPAVERELMLRMPELASGGFLMVPVVGSRQPMAWTLLSGLIEALDDLDGHTERTEQHRKALQSLLDMARTEGSVAPQDIAQAIESVAQVARLENPGVLGLIIVYDELGKSLEHATLNPDRSDVGLLQVLAEAASRSQDPVVALVTILHQAFEHYATSLSPLQRREWEKVQGRFEDIPFQQSNGELLSLVGRAIRQRRTDDCLQRTIQLEALRADELSILPKDLSKESGLEALVRCAPLHPSVALVLGRLFRSRLAQNERSLFAFLSSGEPHGFQEYLATEAWQANRSRPFYRLDRLYDYVQAALGSGLYAHAQGKRWAEIEDALERLPADADPLDAAVVKAIGMLNLLGDQRYLKASRDVLGYALADGHITADDVGHALERLQHLSIAVYRRFQDAYALWQGSDVDLEECYERGRAQLENVDLAEALGHDGQLQPYVAKRHLHETGTLRYFAPRVIDLERLHAVGEQSPGQADGAVVFVLAPAGTRLADAVERVSAFSASLPVSLGERLFFAVPRSVHGIREGYEELAAWRWVIENVVELEGDSIARRELKGRELAARERLGRAISHCFGLSSAYASSVWIRQGKILGLSSARQLASSLSDACDEVFHAAPIVRNELINRQSLSTAAAAARRNLIEAMLKHGREKRLGIQGFPPEASIYLSVLGESGLHHEEEEGWAFGPAEGGDQYRVRPLWEAIDRFLTGTEAGSQPITGLYDTLRRPPFGIKEGLLPIYLTAALLHWASEVALYEQGTFVPEVGIAELERLLRAPERFSVQRYRLSTARMRLLTGYARLFNPEVEPNRVSMLDSLRMLMGFAMGLPRFTQLTDRLGSEAKAVRKALYSAREPQTLLFRVLPSALAFDSLDDDVAVDNYLERLRATLLELQHTYDRLLQSIRGTLLSALRLPADVTSARQEIRQRASVVQDYVADMRLRGFLFRLRDDRLADREWTESVAAMVTSKPPRNWADADAQAFGAAVTELAGQLRRVEEVALARAKTTGGDRVVGLSIIDESGNEQRDLLRIQPEWEPDLKRAMEALQHTLRELELDPQTELAALALLAQGMLARRAVGGEEGHD